MEQRIGSEGSPRFVPETVFRTALAWEIRRAECFGESFALVHVKVDELRRDALKTLLPDVIRRCDLAACRADGICEILQVRAQAGFPSEFADYLRDVLRRETGADGNSLTLAAVRYPRDGASPEALEAAAVAALEAASSHDPRQHIAPPPPASGTPAGDHHGGR
jgi:hypothetical protein